jgi:PAS domain S-box-containing protein
VKALYDELTRTRAALVEVKEDHQKELWQRVRNETALRLSEVRYRAFVEQSTEAIWCFELERPVPVGLPHEEQLRHLYHHAFLAECNDATARLYGYDRAEEMKGRRLSQLLPASERSNVESMREFVRSAYRVADVETREHDRFGQVRYFRNNRFGIVENGNLRRWWGTQRDVTDLIEAEDRREESERRLRLALSAADMGTWDWDVAGGSLQCSAELNRIFGLPARESHSPYVERAQFIAPEDRSHVRRSFFTALRHGTEWECEFRIRRLDGTICWLLVRGDLTRDARGRVRHMVGAATDITARREAEAERERIERKMQDAQKLESLGVLAGGIAHDFNNLLTGVIGHASLAMRADPPGVRRRLNEITGIAQRAAELCHQLLAYAGKGRPCIGTIEVSRLVEETAPLVQLSISKKAMMVFEMVRGLPPVLADATQLRQIVINLVMNASDALGANGGHIVLRTGAVSATRADFHDARTCPEEPAGDYVFLEVHDNGCGMTPETLARIFDPFFSTKFTGRGLGLAAVIGIVRAHNGALFVNSAPGRGTVFRLLLPEAPQEKPPAISEEKLAADFRGAGTVLIVDDEEMVRSVAIALLEKAGFTTIEAKDGAEALDFFAADSAHYAAVLLDVSMAGLDGFEVLTRLRALRADVPIILMSGRSESELAEMCVDIESVGIVQKPFRAETLVSKLRAMLPASGGS